MTGSTIALLSLGQPADHATEGPRGLLPLFGTPILGRQVHQLLDLGVRRFLIATTEQPGALVQVMAEIRSCGGEVEVISTPADLAARAKGEDSILVVADGLCCNEDLLSEFVNLAAPRVAVLEDNQETQGFERIDLNHRWAGIAVANSRSAASLQGLPPDWSIESALMRQALRDGAPRTTIALRQAPSSNLRIIGSEASASALEWERISEPCEVSGPIDRHLFAPLSRWMLRRFVRHPHSALAFNLAPVLLAALALLAAWAQNPLTACALGLTALAARSIRTRARRVQRADVHRLPTSEAVLVLLALSLFFLLGPQPAEALGRTALLTGLAVLIVQARLYQSVPWWPGFPELVVALLLGTALGSPLFGWWVACFVCVGVLLAMTYRQRTEQLRAS